MIRAAITAFFLIFLAGCQPIPIVVNYPWPEIPPVLTNGCPNLTLAPTSKELSSLLNTVAENYAKYHECQARVDLWREWYQINQEAYKKITNDN